MIVIYAELVGGVLAYGELISRQETVDEPNDVSSNLLSTGDADEDLTLKYEVEGANRLIDIGSVSYYTEGNTLNAVFWLSNFNMNPNFVKLFEKSEDLSFSYGMKIDITSNNKEGLSPSFDYDVTIHCSCQPNNITWTMVYKELSHINSNVRTLKETGLEQNQTQKGDNYVVVPVDLSIVGFPEEYRLQFYSTYSYGAPLVTVQDVTNMVTIPPPIISLSVLPPAVEIRQGESRYVVLQVNASKQFTPLVHLSEDNPNKDNFRLALDRSQLNVPSFGMDRTGLTITAFDNAKVSSYPILVSAETGMSNDSTITSAEKITAQAILLIDVKPKLEISEQIRLAWEDWGQAVTGFHALIVAVIAGLSPFFGNIIRKKLKHK
jgi:hypothetical protein